MSLKKKIEDKLNQALKDKDKKTYPTLRLIVSAMKDAEIANRTKGNTGISDGDVMGILKKMIKQRNESCEVYKKAGRNELLENETREIEVINFFLPKQMSEADTKRICEEAIKSAGATSIKDMGKVMGVIKANHANSVDFSKVSVFIKELLK